MILVLLNAKLGMLSQQQQVMVRALSADQLQALGLALLNFTDFTDLVDWLSSYR
jgi:hypothetical protein